LQAEGGYNNGTRVYVGGLTENVKKEDLEREFEKYGKLNNVWVAFNPPGFAFITFENGDEAETAVDNLNGMDIMGVKIRVEVSRSRGRGRGGGFRGDSRGRGGRGGAPFYSRGGSRGGRGGGDYQSRGFRGSSRGGPRGGGGRGRFDSYDSYGSRDDKYSRNDYGGGDSYYRSSASRYRSRSPVGRGRYLLTTSTRA
jgi:RNA recognition motif-containing protein